MSRGGNDAASFVLELTATANDLCLGARMAELLDAVAALRGQPMRGMMRRTLETCVETSSMPSGSGRKVPQAAGDLAASGRNLATRCG
jgi:hypothetical protein